MDGSPQCGCSNATTLWHLDAEEWAPSTASKSAGLTFNHPLPVYPDKRTSEPVLGMSQRCHKQPHAPQETGYLFDHLVGAGEERLGNIQTERLSRLQIDDQFEFDR